MFHDEVCVCPSFVMDQRTSLLLMLAAGTAYEVEDAGAGKLGDPGERKKSPATRPTKTKQR